MFYLFKNKDTSTVDSKGESKKKKKRSPGKLRGNVSCTRKWSGQKIGGKC